MKGFHLIPRIYGSIGWIGFITFAILGLSSYHLPGFKISNLPSHDIFSTGGNDLSDEVAIVGAVASLLLICFARVEQEDEYSLQVRLKSWQWTVIISYLSLIIINFTTYGIQFNGLLVYLACAIPLFFILTFRYNINNARKSDTLLIPRKYKTVGWIVLLALVPMGLSSIYLGFEIPGFILWGNPEEGKLLVMPNSYNLTNEFILTGVVAGLLMVCFAKRENEDEYISYLRLIAWQWSILLSSLVFIFLTLFCYGPIYYHVLLYNMFAPLVVFIARFSYQMHQLSKGTEI